MEPRKTTQVPTHNRQIPLVDPSTLVTAKENRYRLAMDLAKTVMPETTENFVLNKDAYIGTRLYRVEKKVGVYGGDVLTNTGKSGRAANGRLRTQIRDPLAMWHVPGTVTMLVPSVEEVDSRFLLVSQLSPHLDGISRAFGRLTEESLKIVEKWETTLLTRKGIPSAYDLIVTDVEVADSDAKDETVEEQEEQSA